MHSYTFLYACNMHIHEPVYVCVQTCRHTCIHHEYTYIGAMYACIHACMCMICGILRPGLLQSLQKYPENQPNEAFILIVLMTIWTEGLYDLGEAGRVFGCSDLLRVVDIATACRSTTGSSFSRAMLMGLGRFDFGDFVAQSSISNTLQTIETLLIWVQRTSWT